MKGGGGMAALVPELEELYQTYKTELYRYLCGLTQDPAAAEDLLSETFVRVLRYLPAFRGESSVRTWLYSIARRTWLNSLQKSRAAVSLDELFERYMWEGPPAHTSADARQTLARVRELLAQRGGRDAAVITLRAQGYSYAEIAAQLHINENTARVAEHRTRAWLKATLQEEGYTDV